MKNQIKRIKQIMLSPEVISCEKCSTKYIAFNLQNEEICPICKSAIYEDFEELPEYEYYDQDELLRMIGNIEE